VSSRITATGRAFVFHAEDGIRDRNVTGVQTCALPILIGRDKKRAAIFPSPLESSGNPVPLSFLFYFDVSFIICLCLPLPFPGSARIGGHKRVILTGGRTVLLDFTGRISQHPPPK